ANAPGPWRPSTAAAPPSRTSWGWSPAPSSWRCARGSRRRLPRPPGRRRGRPAARASSGARRGSPASRAGSTRASGAPGPGLVLVEGEAGLGKTTLAFELAAWAREQGCVALWAQAYEPDRDLAFAPVRRL